MQSIVDLAHSTFDIFSSGGIGYPKSSRYFGPPTRPAKVECPYLGCLRGLTFGVAVRSGNGPLCSGMFRNDALACGALWCETALFPQGLQQFVRAGLSPAAILLQASLASFAQRVLPLSLLFATLAAHHACFRAVLRPVSPCRDRPFRMLVPSRAYWMRNASFLGGIETPGSLALQKAFISGHRWGRLTTSTNFHTL